MTERVRGAPSAGLRSRCIANARRVARRTATDDRTQELEDREAIRRIFADYAGYLDAGDHAGYASLFADDGVMAAQLGEAVGPAAIEATLDAALGPSVRATFPSAVHVMNNQRIDIEGDTATTDVLWFYLTTDDDGVPTILQAGRYTDRLVKRNGEWKLSRHDISRLMGRSPTAPPPETRLDRLERRVQRLEDREAIWHLFLTYKRHLDQRDFKAYACAVHRRRGVGGQPRQGGRPGRDRGAADPHDGGVPERPRTHLPPGDERGDRRRWRHGHGPLELGLRHAQRVGWAGVRDARSLSRRPASNPGRMAVLAPVSPTATSPTSPSTGSSDRGHAVVTRSISRPTSAIASSWSTAPPARRRGRATVGAARTPCTRGSARGARRATGRCRGNRARRRSCAPTWRPSTVTSSRSTEL